MRDLVIPLTTIINTTAECIIEAEGCPPVFTAISDPRGNIGGSVARSIPTFAIDDIVLVSF